VFNQSQLKKEIPDIRPGDVVRVFLRLAEKTKRGGEKIQIFEGLVLAKKHGKGPNATFTVRKISEGVGVERIFPLHLPSITKIELVKRSKVRRAKLYYMRELAGKKARMRAQGTSIPSGTEKLPEVDITPEKDQPEEEIERKEK